MALIETILHCFSFLLWDWGESGVCATSFSNIRLVLNIRHHFSGETYYIQHFQLFSLQFLFSKNTKNKQKQHGETGTVHETKGKQSYFRNRSNRCIDEGIKYTDITLKTRNKNITEIAHKLNSCLRNYWRKKKSGKKPMGDAKSVCCANKVKQAWVLNLTPLSLKRKLLRPKIRNSKINQENNGNGNSLVIVLLKWIWGKKHPARQQLPLDRAESPEQKRIYPPKERMQSETNHVLHLWKYLT